MHWDRAHTVVLVLAVVALVAGCGGTAASPPTLDSASAPSPSATLTATVSPGPSSSSSPAVTTPSSVSTVPVSFPVLASAQDAGVSMVPGPDGSLYVSVTHCREGDPEFCTTVVAALDEEGAIQPGWPAVGRSIPAEVVGDRYEVRDAGDEGARLVRIEADGTEHFGAVVPMGWYAVASPAGTAFSVSRVSEGSEVTPTITSFDLDGVVPGWPVQLPRDISDPAPGPNGRVYLVQQTSVEVPSGGVRLGPARMIVLGPNGQPWAEWSVSLPEALPHRGSWADPYMPMPPLVAADGSAWLVTDTTATAVDAAGRILPGWPYRASVSLGPVGWCPPCDLCGVPCAIDCSDWRTTPILGPDKILYLLQDAPSTTGGQISAIGLDGKMLDGWPVQLRRPGATFNSAVLGRDGTLYALAIEPETYRDPPADSSCVATESATVLAIGPDGRVRYRATVVEP
jgi:hypothetical protein